MGYASAIGTSTFGCPDGLRTVGNPAFLGRTPGPTEGPRDPDGTHTPECVPSVPQTGPRRVTTKSRRHRQAHTSATRNADRKTATQGETGDHEQAQDRRARRCGGADAHLRGHGLRGRRDRWGGQRRPGQRELRRHRSRRRAVDLDAATHDRRRPPRSTATRVRRCQQGNGNGSYHFDGAVPDSEPDESRVVEYTGGDATGTLTISHGCPGDDHDDDRRDDHDRGDHDVDETTTTEETTTTDDDDHDRRDHDRRRDRRPTTTTTDDDTTDDHDDRRRRPRTPRPRRRPRPAPSRSSPRRRPTRSASRPARAPSRPACSWSSPASSPPSWWWSRPRPATAANPSTGRPLR